MTAVPEWMHPPRAEGWFADDLDYWRVEDEDGLPVVHTYELDGPTRSYAPTGIHRHELSSPAPFAIKLDLDRLLPARER